MNSDTKDTIKFFGTMAIIVMIIISVLGGLIWSLSPAWVDQGTITSVGQKTYTAYGWNTPYTVQTLNHGTLSLTTGSTPIWKGTDNGVSPVVGLLVGVQQRNGGGYHVEADP